MNEDEGETLKLGMQERQMNGPMNTGRRRTYRRTHLWSQTHCCVWRLWWWTRRVGLPGPERHGSVHHSESDSPAGHQTNFNMYKWFIHWTCFFPSDAADSVTRTDLLKIRLVHVFHWLAGLVSGWSIISCSYVKVCAEIITLRMLLCWFPITTILSCWKCTPFH